jgi:radical SAM family uncharacterized protein/radical SAM-linked protein
VPVLRQKIEAGILPFVEQPMRYIGNEVNIIRKDPALTRLHGVFCFPDLYDLGMSHYGTQVLYHIVNSRAQWALSRCYLPWPDAAKLMRSQSIPLYCLEYFTPLVEADWLGFTLQYELQYANVLTMLDLAGLPPASRDRRESDPMVIAGGPCAANPEPLADFVDAFVIGDGEESVVALCSLLEKLKQAAAPRAEKLRALADLDGVYVPSLRATQKNSRFITAQTSSTAPVSACKIKRIDENNAPIRQLVPLMEVVHHRLAVEVMRGCTRGCRFCAAGIAYRPVRERPAAAIARQIEQSIVATGWRDVGLLSLSTADYSGLGGLLRSMRGLRDKTKTSFSLPSTRIDALSAADLAELNAVSPASSFTIAPEAGSQRLRSAINKDFSNETILDTVRRLLANNIQTLKLYFMVGLPTETDADIDAMISLIETIAGLVRAASKRRMVNVSLSPFSPKPHTPFQWEAMDSPENLKAKSERVRAALRHRSNVKVSIRDPHITLLETALARGDRQVGELILHALRRGAGLDGWDEWFDFNHWSQAAAEIGLDFATYTAEIAETETLPWDVVSLGVTTEFLKAERAASRQGASTDDCRTGGCSDCGVCTGRSHELTAAVTAMPVEEQAPVSTQPSVPVQKLHYRFVYRRGPDVRFLAHLDMVNCIHRALFAAEIPLAFSEGFHPHPRIAFGPPLSQGIMGSAEMFDIQTTKPIDPERLSANLWLPHDLYIERGRLCGAKPEPLNAAIVAGCYRIMPIIPLTADAIAEAVDKAQNASSIFVTVTRKEITTEKDLKPLIYKLASVTEAGITGIAATLSMLPGKTCRVDELIPVLFPGKQFNDFLVTRIACLDASGPLTDTTSHPISFGR